MKMANLARIYSNAIFSSTLASRGFSTLPLVESYQILERSIVPSMHFQKSLPRLPIPKLEKTMERYLSAVKPILSENDYEKAEKLAKEFENGAAKDLHQELLNNDKKNKDTSYISEPWFDMYLKARVPLPVNYNPFMAWTPDPDAKYNDQLSRATNLVISACRFKRSLDAGILSPEVYHMDPAKTDTKTYRRVMRLLPPSVSWYGSYLLFKAFPLDMSQYPSLFNSTRIPVVGKDQLRRYPNGRHVLVLRKGHFFAVDVLDKNGMIKPPQEIHAYLNHVRSMPLENAKNPLGVLTTLDRDRWAAMRSQLIEGTNEQVISTIDSALFVLCLDDVRASDPVSVSKNLLHTDGSNRWYDKSFSIIVQADGLSAINFEHSWGDGVAVLRLMEDLQKDTRNNRWISSDMKPATGVDLEKNVRKLEFKLNQGLEDVVKEASSKYKSWVNKLEYGTLEYTKMNREYVKKQKLSPDAIMQAAIQVAFYRQYNKRVATYESCSTAAFKHGRTETVRSATSDTNRLTDALLSKNKSSPNEIRGILEACSKKHSELVKEAAMGQGFDRHLFGMKHMAERRGGRMPAFYTDDIYQRVNRYVLSTSTLSTDTVLIGGFGPVVPDGYGIGYNVGESKLGCIISAYSDTRNASEFVKCLEKSLDDIHGVFEATKSGK